jgi:hypothetical protein
MKITRLEERLTNPRGNRAVRRGIDPNRKESKSWGFETSVDIIVISALGIVAFALYSIRLKQDINWDLQNYHYYTAHAFLNGRLKQDLLPAGIQSYLNPLPYVHYYLLVNYLPPKWAAAATGALQGLSVPLVYLLSSRVVVNKYVVSPRDRFVVASLATVVGVASPMLLSEIGTSFADIYSAQLITLSLIILFGPFVQVRDRISPMPIQILGAGLIVGMATGCKLTNAVFALAGAFSILTITAPRFLNLCVWVFGGVIGFALTGGVWAVRVFNAFGNPFFPYWNGIFLSSLFRPSNLSEGRYIPRSLWHALTYPFLWSTGNNTTAEIGFTDIRYGVFSVLIIPATVIFIRSLVFGTRNSRELENTTGSAFANKVPALFIFVFYVTSYALWLAIFGEQRFAVPLELLSGIFLLILCDLLGRVRLSKLLILSVVSLLIIVCMKTSSWGRVRWTKTWFDLSVPQELLDPKAVYLKTEHRNAYVIPFFPQDARFFGIGSDSRLDRTIKHLVDSHKGPRRVLAYEQIERGTGEVLKSFGYQIDDCVGFRSKNDRFVACNLIRWQKGELLKVPLPHRPAP